MVCGPCLFLHSNFPPRGFGHPRINSGAPPKRQEKQSLQAFFPVLARAASSLGVLGACSPQAVPRASECGVFCLRGHAPQSRPQIQARCKNQRSALVPKYTAPEPGPSGGLPNLPLPLVAQKGTFRNLPGARTSRFHLYLTSRRTYTRQARGASTARYSGCTASRITGDHTRSGPM